MQVDVKNGLAGIGVRIDHSAIPALRQSFGLRELCGHQMHLADDVGVLRLVQRHDVLPRNDQNMNGRLRVDIPERDAMLVLRDDVCRNLFLQNAAEETVGGHVTSSESKVAWLESLPRRR